MNKGDYLKDYYKTLEEAPLDVLEEYEGNALAAHEDYKTSGDKKSVKEFENDLKRVRELMKKSWRNLLMELRRCGKFQKDKQHVSTHSSST